MLCLLNKGLLDPLSYIFVIQHRYPHLAMLMTWQLLGVDILDHPVVVKLCATNKRSQKCKVNCRGHVAVSTAQRQVMHHPPVTAERTKVYVLYARTSGSVMQWMREGSPRGQVRLLLCILQGLYTYCAIYLLSYYGV